MNVPLEISYKNVTKTDEIDALLHRETDKLERFCDHISSCVISVEKPQEHISSGSPYRVRIDVRVPPGHELVSRREPGDGNMHEELSTVIKDTFEGMRRQLDSLNEKQHQDVKRHGGQMATAIVEKIFPEEGYGILKNLEGRDVYFHKNSVLHNDFDRLAVGTGVWYFEEMGEKGLQASTVRIVDKPGKREEAGPEG